MIIHNDMICVNYRAIIFFHYQFRLLKMLDKNKNMNNKCFNGCSEVWVSINENIVVINLSIVRVR